jgi:hypothetical protein
MSDKYLYLCDLAEKSERYDDIPEILESFLKSTDRDLKQDERYLLYFGYHVPIISCRRGINLVREYEMKEKKKEHSNYINYIQDYRNKLEKEYISKCNYVIELIDNILLKRAKDDQSVTQYLKMKGCYLRYIVEIAQGELKSLTTKLALDTYQLGLQTSKSLSYLNTTKLSLIIEFTVFYYDLKDIETACKLTKETIHLTENELLNFSGDEENYRDVMGILNLLNENLNFWTKETEINI